MRVTIQHGEKTTGMLRKKTHYTVALAVQFSAEELETIKKRKLSDAIVMERDPGSDSKIDADYVAKNDFGDHFYLKISTLMKGRDVYACSTPLDAKDYDIRLKDRLRVLKSYLEGNADASQGAETFEL